MLNESQLNNKTENKSGSRFEALLANQNWHEAEAMARHQLAKLAHDSEAHAQGLTMMSRIALARQDLSGMRKWLDRIRRIFKNDERLLEFGSSMLVAADQAEEAIEFLKSDNKLVQEPGLPTLVAKAIAFCKLGKLEAAAEQIEICFCAAPLIANDQIAQLATKFCETGFSPGWMGRNECWQVCGLILGSVPDDAVVSIKYGSDSSQTIQAMGMAQFKSTYGSFTGSSNHTSFVLEFDIPPPGDIQILVSGTPLLGSGKRSYGPKIEGIVELEGSIISGWAQYPDRPDLPVVIYMRDEVGQETELVTKKVRTSDSLARYEFRYDLKSESYSPGIFRFFAGPLKTDLAGSPIGWFSTENFALRPEDQFAEPDYGSEFEILGASFPNILGIPHVPSPVENFIPRPSGMLQIPRDVDIIIPVYGGGTETLDCIHSVINSDLPAGTKIIVVDDASPDLKLISELEKLELADKITLIRNPLNIGFPGTANRGMARNPNSDKVLLNADTLVVGDWIARLRATAYAQKDCGTVTPLSNNATICTYPSPAGRRPGSNGARLPEAPTYDQIKELDQLACDLNRELNIEIPTAIGFCMYIKAECLVETGYFSETAFGRGYGEETDFCMRARQRGWRHMAASNVYVGHIGGHSFGRQKALLLERNGRMMERLHPGYHGLVQRFQWADPLAFSRRKLDVAKLKQHDRNGSILFISSDLEGGVERHLTARCESVIANGTDAFILLPGPSIADGKVVSDLAADPLWRKRCRLVRYGDAELNDLLFDPLDEFDVLVDLLKELGVRSVEIHHTTHHVETIIDLPRYLKVPFDVVIHDYHWICPRVTLIGVSNRYCGEPDVSACEVCAISMGSALGQDTSVAELRETSANILKAARSVIVSSQEVANRLSKYFPGMNVKISPWDNIMPPLMWAPALNPEHRRIRVCLIGAIGPHKGYDTLIGCARDAIARDLPLEFVVVGYSNDDGSLFLTDRVFLTGKYEEQEAVDLICAQSADIALLPSVCPETWSYSLSLAWRAGLKVIAFDLGTIAERIKMQDGGWVLPLGTDPAAINDAIIRTVTGNKSEITIGSTPSVHRSYEMSTTSSQTVDQINVTTQNFILAKGFYSVTVRRGGAPIISGQIQWPAVQVQPAPSDVAFNSIEILAAKQGGWLTGVGDTVLLKVSNDAPVLITSYTAQNDSVERLQIELSRVDAAGGAIAPASLLPELTLLAHVQLAGDKIVKGVNWAGLHLQNRWVEALAIDAQGGVTNDEIEYKTLAANGRESDWTKGGNLSGSKGNGIPLMGFAVQLVGAAADKFDCYYRATFVGGSSSVICKNGTPCRSDFLGAALESFWVSIVPKGQSPLEPAMN